MDAIALSLFSSRVNAICGEMGATLRRAAFSPNIRDRLDYSCAVFDAEGQLCAQAAHIPVHLGSMAFAMRDIVTTIDWRPGDMIILNNPYLGGTHLPDVTLIMPVFFESELIAYLANRAHHADIGCDTPGSMPVSSTLEEEGLVIDPIKIVSAGETDEGLVSKLCKEVRSPTVFRGDIGAQISANLTGGRRLLELVSAATAEVFKDSLCELNNYAERLAAQSLRTIPPGVYNFTDYLDDDGQGARDLAINVTIKISPEKITVDFAGTAEQARGNINCPLSVAAAAVYYVFRCLMPPETPPCAGSFRLIDIHAPSGSLVNAKYPAAVVAGNVETSSRIVDALLGALALALPEKIPAASQGTMNNVAMGGDAEQDKWDYYETIGGGMGAHSNAGGLSGKQTHMTNTLNTPIEVLEMLYPLRLMRYCIRRDSGGRGLHDGGDGVVREYQYTAPATVTLLTERRARGPWGLNGGEPGEAGRNLLNGREVPGKVSLHLRSGDLLTVETPGGGGWGNLHEV
ncbi:MAG: hydantoinase B/oxoprolinase family protein [Gammaproteobacteria bacterium]|nr:hydantoinase B/oxoprolinase family protein [Gammaproteobacteria bacterium]